MMPATVDLPASSQSTTVRQPVRLRTFMSAWGRLLNGYSPLLSIEITRECPLHCPGCYAYDDNHLGGGVTLRPACEGVADCQALTERPHRGADNILNGRGRGTIEIRA
jgi:hypothetical protein